MYKDVHFEGRQKLNASNIFLNNNEHSKKIESLTNKTRFFFVKDNYNESEKCQSNRWSRGRCSLSLRSHDHPAVRFHIDQNLLFIFAQRSVEKHFLD